MIVLSAIVLSIVVSSYILKCRHTTNYINFKRSKSCKNFVISKVLEFISNEKFSYLVAHNGDNYDFLMFREHLRTHGYNLNNLPIRSLDTLLLAKKLYPHLSKYSLSTLCTQLNCGVLGAHRAEGDTRMVQNLFRYMLNDLEIILSRTESLSRAIGFVAAICIAKL